MRELFEIQADLLRCCDIRKMTEMGELLDELTELFERSSDKGESETGQPKTKDLTKDYRDKTIRKLNTIQDVAFLKKLYYLILSYENRTQAAGQPNKSL